MRVHITFAFIVAYFAFVWGVLQEPGGLSAALYGVLLPIGGMAQMEEIPRDPRKEFTISVVGPLSDLVLGLVMFGVSFLFIDYGSITSVARLNELLLSISP